MCTPGRGVARQSFGAFMNFVATLVAANMDYKDMMELYRSVQVNSEQRNGAKQVYT